MAGNSRRNLDLRTATTAEITEAMRRGLAEALGRHREAGQPVVIWDRARGQIVTRLVEPISRPGGGPDATSRPTEPR